MRKYSYRSGGVAITEDRIGLKIKRVITESNKRKEKTTPGPVLDPSQVTSPTTSSSQHEVTSEDEVVCCVC